MAAMKLSLFTPTNNPIWLRDLHRSLQVQAYQNFEWVIAVNSGVRLGQIPEEIVRWPHTRIVPGPDVKNIGALKRFACEQCRGDVYVEMDHDDMLVPGALGHIAEAATRGGFIHSDDAVFYDDGKMTPHAYASAYGWESYPFHAYNQRFLATRAFTITPRSLCSVHFAPDHVRAWTREAYAKAGGHDPNLLVADDHDLVCRTYIAGVEFAHTGYCDYLYRMHPYNTVNRYNRQIQDLQAENRDAYLHRLIDEWCRRHNFPTLDLSEFATAKAMEDRLGKQENWFGCVRAVNCLQHLEPAAVGHILDRIHKVLLPDGFLCLECPSTQGPQAFLLHHRSYWNTEVVEHLTDPHVKPLLSTYRGGFERVRCWEDFASKEARERNRPTLYADLVALKGQRAPNSPRTATDGQPRNRNPR